MLDPVSSVRLRSLAEHDIHRRPGREHRPRLGLQPDQPPLLTFEENLRVFLPSVQWAASRALRTAPSLDAALERRHGAVGRGAAPPPSGGVRSSLESQASPEPSESMSSWPGLACPAQLSEASATPSPSSSTSQASPWRRRRHPAGRGSRPRSSCRRVDDSVAVAVVTSVTGAVAVGVCLAGVGGRGQLSATSAMPSASVS